MRIKFFILIGSKHFKPCVHKKSAEAKQQPFKTFNRSNANCYKKYPKNYCHQYSNQQHTRIIFFFDSKRIKNENEDENVINAQAPLHQVSAYIFEGRFLSFLEPHENKKC